MGMLDTLKRSLTGSHEEGETEILAALKQDHRDVAELLDRLVESSAGAERKSLLESIRETLIPHLRAEEKVVYDAVRALKGKEPQQHVEEGYLEHGLADRMLATLAKIANPASPEFSAAAKVLKELVEHHVEEEESSIWDDIRAHVSDADRIEMYRKFEAAKKRVRVPAA